METQETPNQQYELNEARAEIERLKARCLAQERMRVFANEQHDAMRDRYQEIIKERNALTARAALSDLPARAAAMLRVIHEAKRVTNDDSSDEDLGPLGDALRALDGEARHD